MATDTLQSAVRMFTSQASNPVYKESDARAVTNAALVLIRQLPVARNAALSYFGRRFDDAANKYLQAQVDKVTGNPYNQHYNEQLTYESLSPIAENFSELTKDKSWAPQLSKWAIDLLGHISRKLVSSNAAPLSTSINTVEEKMELWMGCSATKILIDITSNCFTILVDEPSSVDSGVESILDASIRYAPHFDWVVAHLGSCFPTTIIDRVLIAGYNDFFSPSQQQNSRFNSATAILGYLSTKHKEAARDCISKYFQNALNQEPPRAATVVTYLLNMANMSPMITRIITSQLSSILTIQALNTLEIHFSCGTHDYQSLLRLAVHLLLRLDHSSVSAINLLLDVSSNQLEIDCCHPPLKNTIRHAATLILNQVVNEMNRGTLCNRVVTRLKPDILTLKVLTQCHRSLTRRLSRVDQSSRRTILRLLLAIAWSSDRTTAIRITVDLLEMNKPWMVDTLDDLISQLNVRYADLSTGIIEEIFSAKSMHSMDCLIKYLQHKSEITAALSAAVVAQHLPDLSIHLDRSGYLETYTGLVLSQPTTCGQDTLETLILWFFESLRKGEFALSLKAQKAVLVVCGQSLALLTVCMNHILQLSTTQPYSVLFSTACVTPAPEEAMVSLSELNSQLLKRLQLPATKSYILHTEHIGQGKKGRSAQENKALVERCSHCLVILLTSCCLCKCSGYDETTAKELLASVLLSTISPDVIASATRWQDPITHERELSVRRIMDTHPFMWQLLSFVSTYKPCVLTISLILRCYLSTVCTAWDTARSAPARSLPKNMEASVKLMRFCVRAQLLPVPLSRIAELFPHISTFEIKLLLEIVYRYLQACIIQGLAKPPLDVDDLKLLQSIVQQNINAVGDFSTKFLIVAELT